VENSLQKFHMDHAAKGDKPFKPMDLSVIEKVGDLGPVNYLKIPGMRALDDPYYRTPDWNAFQAGHLSRKKTASPSPPPPSKPPSSRRGLWR
jgi:hypothetical protein